MEEKLILLVEDNPDDVNLAIRAFGKSEVPHQIVVARDGAEALDYLFGTGAYAGRDMQIQPAVVLLDLKLPVLSGMEVLERLRANDRTRLLPVVIFSTSVEEEDIARSYALGANSYVRKPVDFKAFLNTAQHLATYWLKLNIQPSSS